MDIFNVENRGRDDAIKKPLNYPHPEQTQKKLQNQYQRQTQKFELYLKNLYAKFDYKINKCKYGCVSKAKNYSQARSCDERCSDGVNKFSSYVDSRVAQMQQLLGQCVSNASTLPNSMDQTYYCYQRYNRGFNKLKQFIAQESMYYE